MFFITSNLLTAEDQICGKVLVANEKNEYSKPRLTRIRFDRRFYPILAKIRVNRR